MLMIIFLNGSSDESCKKSDGFNKKRAILPDSVKEKIKT